MAAIDLTARYTLTNSLLGSNRVIASTLNSDQIVIETNGADQSSQWWYFTSSNLRDLYRMHTDEKGSEQSLDIIPNADGAGTMAVHFYDTIATNTSQLWRLDKSSDGTYRLSNNNTGPDVRLSVNSSSMGFVLATGDADGQHWTLSRVGSAPSTPSALPSSTPFSSSASPSASSSSDHKDLSIGAIVGIAIGSAAFVAGILGLAYYFWRRSKRSPEPAPNRNIHMESRITLHNA